MVQIFEEFKEYIITGVISLLTAIAGWWAGKRKTTAETEVVETDVIKSIRELSIFSRVMKLFMSV